MKGEGIGGYIWSLSKEMSLAGDRADGDVAGQVDFRRHVSIEIFRSLDIVYASSIIPIIQ